MTKSKNKLCVLDYAFQRIGGKYKGRILLSLHKNQTLRYGELTREINDVSTKMLTQALKELENDELIIRKVFSEIPPRVEYSLSEMGKEFLPMLHQLIQWGTVIQAKNLDQANN